MDIEGRNPGPVLDELHGGGGAVEAREQRDADEKSGDRADQCKHPRQRRVAVASGGQNQQAGRDRQPDDPAQ